MSPPLSPPPPSSPAPTMVPPLNSTERRENLSSSSPGNGGLAGLHHALHGLHNLHNLHNLHSLQNLQTQMAALAGLQGSLGVPGVSSLLHSHLAAQHSPGPAPENIASSLPSNVNSGSPSNNQNGGNQGSVPQMVLTAGQVLKNIEYRPRYIHTCRYTKRHGNSSTKIVRGDIGVWFKAGMNCRHMNCPYDVLMVPQ
ncbi:hypothetical protein Anas_05134 [Armadillidium nasatum]|uniref:Uncharacterized protein n=1 Tax=Armadillidium nasatum TaxID=96803 RepID=A0A5N5ST71_9CRUS|nr:hypothetical protein Anas_05134 [Armadillidium nasatum]